MQCLARRLACMFAAVTLVRLVAANALEANALEVAAVQALLCNLLLSVTRNLALCCCCCRQPIDVMLGLSFLVKRAHKSIPGLWLQENDTTMTGTCSCERVGIM